MNRYKIWVRGALVITAALLVGVVLGIMLQRGAGKSGSLMPRTPKGDKLSWALSLIDQRYVDSISRDSLAEMAIPVILKDLDPHSVYVTAAEFAATNEPLTGSFDGIGVMFNMMTDTVLITNVISGGPSHKSGIVAGDRIITIEDSIVAGRKVNQDNIVKMLRGKRGTKVKLGVERSSSRELIPFTITRDVIPVKSLEASFMAGPGVGYVRFGRFAATTYKEVLAAMTNLKAQGATKIIMDLRGNSGGYLDQAIYIANEFLRKGEKIVYTEGVASPRMDQDADGNGSFQDIELAVLIDEYSASASEIVAGAIQDNDRGMIVGRRSFGKGLVQEQFPYPDGSAIRLTIARYYTPVGRSIQKPYTPGKDEEYELEVYKRYGHDELSNADSIPLVDSLRFMTPKGKVVYGGGGIAPDIFVPVDTVAVTKFFLEQFRKNLIFKFATQLTESNRSRINAIKSIDELDAFFAGRDLVAEFVTYAARSGVRASSADLEQSRDLILSQIKGYVGRNTPLEENAFYYYMMPNDEAIKQTINEFKNPGAAAAAEAARRAAVVSASDKATADKATQTK